MSDAVNKRAHDIMEEAVWNASIHWTNPQKQILESYIRKGLFDYRNEIKNECAERAVAWLLRETASVESDLDLEWRYRQKIGLTVAIKGE